MSDFSEHFSIACGSIVGREHVRCHRNNQDAVAVHGRGDLLVAAVADGCSSGKYSEVGSRLAVRWLTEQTHALWRRDPTTAPEVFAFEATDRLADYLGEVGRGLCLEAACWPGTVRDFLLFSFLVAVIGEHWTVVFGLGDGVVSINGRTSILDPGPSNAPPYLGYRLVSPDVAVSQSSYLRPTIYFAAPTLELTSILIATDGLAELQAHPGALLKGGNAMGGIDTLEQDARFQRNPSLLQKRLVVLGEVNGRLKDDTTVVILRRKEGES